MLGLSLQNPRKRAPRFLFIGAHADDLEIGCGGTAIELARRYPRSTFRWVVLSGDSTRHAEARRAVRALLGTSVKIDLELHSLRESHFPSQLPDIKATLERLKKDAQPDVVLSHFGGDLHQDHRTVSEAVWNTFRDHLILEYEIPKFDGGLGSPSFFVPLGKLALRRKVGTLMKVFKSQHGKRWFTPDTFHGLMRLRGIECNAPSGFAEAFYARKIVLGTD